MALLENKLQKKARGGGFGGQLGLGLSIREHACLV